MREFSVLPEDTPRKEVKQPSTLHDLTTARDDTEKGGSSADGPPPKKEQRLVQDLGHPIPDQDAVTITQFNHMRADTRDVLQETLDKDLQSRNRYGYTSSISSLMQFLIPEELRMTGFHLSTLTQPHIAGYGTPTDTDPFNNSYSVPLAFPPPGRIDSFRTHLIMHRLRLSFWSITTGLRRATIDPLKLIVAWRKGRPTKRRSRALSTLWKLWLGL